MKEIGMTFEQWVEKYKPIENPFVGGIMFETYGQEIEFVKNQIQVNFRCVWSDMDTDGYNWIESGVRRVNRIGYYITEIPFQEGEHITIPLSEPDPECEES